MIDEKKLAELRGKWTHGGWTVSGETGMELCYTLALALAAVRAILAKEETTECTNPKCGHNFVCDECKAVIEALAPFRAEENK